MHGNEFNIFEGIWIYYSVISTGYIWIPYFTYDKKKIACTVACNILFTRVLHMAASCKPYHKKQITVFHVAEPLHWAQQHHRNAIVYFYSYGNYHLGNWGQLYILYTLVIIHSASNLHCWNIPNFLLSSSCPLYNVKSIASEGQWIIHTKCITQ